MRILIINNNNFIRNNFIFLSKNFNFKISSLEVYNETETFESIIKEIDQVFFPCIPENNFSDHKFWTKNLLLIRKLKESIIKSKKKISISFLVSKKTNRIYKRKFFTQIKSFPRTSKISLKIIFTPEIFGKWNNDSSSISKICKAIANNKIYKIKQKKIKVIYIDTLIELVIEYIKLNQKGILIKRLTPQFITSEKKLFNYVKSFKAARSNLKIYGVGKGLLRGLYATYISISNIPKENFTYKIQSHKDERGVFSEFLKNSNFGQVSFFTILPQKSRGGHFHNTKTEKFLVIKGRVQFLFKNVLNKKSEVFEIEGSEPFHIVETIPGWSHEIKNIGQEEAIVLLWANEVFDIKKPDTYGKNYYE